MRLVQVRRARKLLRGLCVEIEIEQNFCIELDVLVVGGSRGNGALEGPARAGERGALRRLFVLCRAAPRQPEMVVVLCVSGRERRCSLIRCNRLFDVVRIQQRETERVLNRGILAGF